MIHWYIFCVNLFKILIWIVVFGILLKWMGIVMKKYIIFLIILMWISSGRAEDIDQLKRFTHNLPTFVGLADVKSKDSVLTVGVFSDKSMRIKLETLVIFKQLKGWGSEIIVSRTEHKRVDVVGLNQRNLSQFKGQVIWVLDAEKSLPDLKKITEKGIFTIGVQNTNYEEHLFATLLYENKSDDPTIERWRLVKLTANCEISPLRFSKKLTEKDYFYGKICD